MIRRTPAEIPKPRLASPSGLLRAVDEHFWWMLATCGAMALALVAFLYLLPFLVPVAVGLLGFLLLFLIMLHALILFKVVTQDAAIQGLSNQIGMVDVVNDLEPGE